MSTELTTPSRGGDRNRVAAKSLAVAVSVYWPAGYWVPSVPWPFQVKGWLLPAETA